MIHCTKTLPAPQRDGWFKKRLVKKEIDIKEKYRENPKEAINKLGKVFCTGSLICY